MDEKKAKEPSIRFAGFNDAWEQRKLGEISDKAVDNRGKTPTISEDGNHPLIEVASLGNGTPDYTKVNKSLSDETFKTELRAYIKEGDILFSTVGSIGLVSLMDSNENAAIAQNIVSFRTKDNYDSKFLYAMLSTEDNQYKAQRIVMGAVQPSIKVSQLVDVEYYVTENMDEQSKLGKYFLNLDNIITLHQRELELMKQYKKAMLQKMFPKEGKDIPEIRFTGFSGAWEQRKLGDVLISLQNNTLSRADLSSEKGVALNVHYGDVLIKFGEYLDIRKETLPMIPDSAIVTKYKASFLQNGDVIVADTAEDDTAGKCSEIAGLTDETVISGLHTIPYRPLIKFATGYLGYYMNSNSYHHQMLPLMQGIKVTSISKAAMQNTIVNYPKLEEEQAEISAFFRNLDNLITFHQRELDSLKNFKKTMLQKMFI